MSKKSFNLYLNADIIKKLRIRSAELEKRPSHLVEELLEKYLAHPSSSEEPSNELPSTKQ